MVFLHEPAHGPDPLLPLDEFRDGDRWFAFMVLPVRLLLKPLLIWSFGGVFEALLSMLYEDDLGELLLRRDPRYQIVVLRKSPAYWIWGDPIRRPRESGIAAIEVVPTYDDAVERCAEILRGWQPGTTYTDPKTLSSADVRRIIRS